MIEIENVRVEGVTGWLTGAFSHEVRWWSLTEDEPMSRQVHGCEDGEEAIGYALGLQYGDDYIIIDED